MHFILSSISALFVLTTFVQTAPTTPLDAAALLKNAQEAQQLNAQFRNADNTTTGTCTNGDTTCVKGAIATCVNGAPDTSKGLCPATQQCFAVPSVKSNGTIITCTSTKSAQSLIEAAGATGGITGSETGGSTASSNRPSASSTSSRASAATATNSESVVTVTVTLTPSIPTTLPPVTQTLSPDQAYSGLSSLLGQGGPTGTTAPDSSSATPSIILFSVFSASAKSTDIPSATVTPSSAPQRAAPDILSSSSLSTAATPTAVGSESGYGAGSY